MDVRLQVTGRGAGTTAEAPITPLAIVQPPLDVAPLYQALLEASSVGVVVVDLATLRVVDANASFQRLVGYTAEELRDLPYAALSHADDRRAYPGLAEVTESSGADTFELVSRYARKDGESVWVRKHGSIVRNAAGRAAFSIFMAEDITAARVAHEAHLAADDRCRRIVETTNEGIWLLDLDGRTVFVNDSMATMLDLSPAELEGRSIFDFSGTQLGTRADQVLSRRVEGVTEPFEIALRRDDRTEIRVLFTTNSIFDDAGVYSGALAMVSDITASTEQQTYLRGLEAQLQESQRLESIGQLAGGIAHDFNNLLLGIRGYGELALMRLERGEDNAAADIRDMLAAAERAEQLTRQLLAFGRRQFLQPSVLDLNEVVREIASLMRQLTGGGIDLRVVLAPTPVIIEVDRTELERVIANLVVNAGEAMPGGGSLVVEVSLSAATSEGVLTVADSGCGMDADTADRVFEPFFSTKGRAGTGFGLATVHGIINQSGGRIVLDSRLGEGTTFEIFLPSSSTPLTTQTDAIAPMQGGGETILLVEDDIMVRTIVTAMLDDLGYNVLVADCGEAARELAVSCDAEIDVLLTDLVMPGMDGRVTAEVIRSLYPGINVLYMSGYAHGVVGRGDGAFELGADFVQKPFGAQQLAERIREIIESGTERKASEEPRLIS